MHARSCSLLTMKEAITPTFDAAEFLAAAHAVEVTARPEPALAPTIVVTVDRRGGDATLPGDSIDATGELEALIAARALLDDAQRAWPFQGYRPTVTFSVNGTAIPGLSGVAGPAIWAAIG